MVSDTDHLPKKPLPQHKVRTSLADRTLDSMFAVVPTADDKTSQGIGSSTTPQIQQMVARKKDDIIESECFLSSIQSLRKSVLQNRHSGGFLGDVKFGDQLLISAWEPCFGITRPYRHP